MSKVQNNIEIFNESEGLITRCAIKDNVLPTTADTFAKGCVLQSLSDGKVYTNTGTVAVPSFQDINDITTSEITTNAITLAKLATGITPSHVVKFLRLGSTITTTALLGVAVDDLVVTILANGTATVAAVATIDTLPADPAGDSYVIVFRAAA